MNQTSTEKRAMIVNLLCEGNSIRATSRLTGASKNTIQKLQADLGVACSLFQDEIFVNLKCRRLQMDEVWAFILAKDRNLPKDKKGKVGFGSVWTWTCLDPESRAIIGWFVGDRSYASAYHFVRDIEARLANRVQLTTDGHRAYLDAVDSAFKGDVDYAMLNKIYTESADGNATQRKYSPGICMGTRKTVITGTPDRRHISTSLIEKSNQTIRMSMRRFTRLTNGHSKKLENHEHALAIFFCFYNFARVNAAHRVTPAMELGISDHVWTVEEMIALIDRYKVADDED
jgi:IS1 family transposase